MICLGNKQKSETGTESSHELESQCQICHPCFYFEVGLEEKNVIKAIVAVLRGGAFALAKPCNYE